MRLFGRRFFFEKVYSKKNYKIPIIIISIFIIGIILTFSITKFYNKKKTIDKEPKVAFVKKIEVEINNSLPEKKAYFKKLKNITIDDFDVVYPEELLNNPDTSSCEENESEDCIKYIVSIPGEYNVTFSSKLISGKEYTVKLIVVDSTKPMLALKDVTITEGETYDVNSFVAECTDNSNTACTIAFVSDETDENGNVIDYSTYSLAGTYKIKAYALDPSGNKSDSVEANLTINAKPVEQPQPQPQPTPKQKTQKKKCTYGDLKYTSSYVLAAKIDSTECAISAEEAENLSNPTGIKFNKMLAKEIKNNYLQNTLTSMNIAGKLTVEITYGPVYNTTKKGVVGYYLMNEAKQTIDGNTTTIARYYVDENGNRVWKINSLNLK